MASQTQIRQQITAQIVAALEGGNTPPWRRPWRVGPNAGFPANVVSRKAYRGINPLLLELAGERHGLSSRWWGTFRQWADLGGKVMPRPSHVPPGRWGTQIVFWSPITKTVTNHHGEDEEDRFFVMRTYTVFNVDQVEGDHLDHLRSGRTEDDTTGSVVIDYEPAEEAITATGIAIRHGGSRAFYSPSEDHVQVPPKASFTEPDEYHETVFHELVHATEHPTRLNWNRKDAENTYALGELVAEIGACYLARELGVPASDNLTNHVAYLGHWLKAMKNDPKFIFTASAQASKAADYLLDFSRSQEAEVDEPEAALVG
jgi:antirestriction protein ArdC